MDVHGLELIATSRAPSRASALDAPTKLANAPSPPKEYVLAPRLAPAVLQPLGARGLEAPATSAMDRATTLDAPTRFLNAKTPAVLCSILAT